MKSRIPLIVAVVGALLLGGATTGSTRASWSDQVVQAGDGITAGKIGFTRSLNKASFAVNKTTATTDTVEITVTDESLGKNMVQRITPTVTPGSGVTAVLRTKVSGSCTATMQAAVNLIPTGQFTTCVVVTVDPATALTTSSVTVSLASHQMRSANPMGWRAPTQTFDIPVAIAQPAVAVPGAPTLTCGSRANSNEYTMSWSSVSAATSYTVWTSTSNLNDASYSSLGTQSSPYIASLGSDGTTFWRVRAINASGPSVFSNTIRVVRLGNGAGNFTCTAVTP